MRKMMIPLVLLMSIHIVWGQEQQPFAPNGCLADPTFYASQHAYKTSAYSDIIKYIRINFHFILKDDGTGNFDEYSDGIGTFPNYSAYAYAQDIVKHCNTDNEHNVDAQPVYLPAPSALKDKNIRYILEGVYIHRNNDWYTPYPASLCYNATKVNPDHVMQWYMGDGPGGTGGSASGTNQMSKNKWGQFANYSRYVSDYGSGDTVSNVMWFHIDAYTRWVNHEIGHLLGLSHTVLWNNGYDCPTTCINGSSNTACDDGIQDTPTAEEVMTWNNCSHHPSAGYTHSYVTSQWCTNNMMDYDSEQALTAGQIEHIHTGLETIDATRTYIGCEAVDTDEQYTDLGFPLISYFGKKVTIGNDSSYADLENFENANIYFSESVDFENFEVKGDLHLQRMWSRDMHNKFEVRYMSDCQF